MSINAFATHVRFATGCKTIYDATSKYRENDMNLWEYMTHVRLLWRVGDAFVAAVQYKQHAANMCVYWLELGGSRPLLTRKNCIAFIKACARDGATHVAATIDNPKVEAVFQRLKFQRLTYEPGTPIYSLCLNGLLREQC